MWLEGRTDTACPILPPSDLARTLADLSTMNSAPDHDFDKKENWKSSAEPVGDLSGADKALQLVQRSDRTYEADPVALRALLWKIDWLLMPLMFIADFLQCESPFS